MLKGKVVEVRVFFLSCSCLPDVVLLLLLLLLADAFTQLQCHERANRTVFVNVRWEGDVKCMSERERDEMARY